MCIQYVPLFLHYAQSESLKTSQDIQYPQDVVYNIKSTQLACLFVTVNLNIQTIAEMQ